jgi:hypothetical protein
MSKKLILVLVVIFFLSKFNLARAEVVINEVMYNLDGSDIDWVEIYNPDVGDVDLTSYFLLISNLTSNHAINNYSGSQVLHQGEYGVIVATSQISNFISKWNNSGNLFTASFSLPNVADSEIAKVEINKGDKISPLSSMTYTVSLGANGDGNSLQLMEDGSWKACEPTPGSITLSSCGNSSSSDTNTSTASSGTTSTTPTTTTTPEPKIKVIENPTMKVKILANALAFAGEPLEIKTSVLGFSNENVILGRAYWNFGDGGSFEQINNFEKFYHTYYYPGEYVLFLEYYQNSFSKTPEATSKMTIKVLPTTVTISKVGDAKDFFIELSNNASSDIDISNWFIMANGKTFILPKNSVIMSKKQMTISGKITGFVYGDQSDLKLFSSTGELVFDYSSPIEPVKILAKNSIPIKVSTALQPLGEAIPPLAEQISAEDLLATPADAQVSVLPPLIIPLASLVFIGTSAGAVYFIRRKKVIPQTGNDFEILDE